MPPLPRRCSSRARPLAALAAGLATAALLSACKPGAAPPPPPPPDAAPAAGLPEPPPPPAQLLPGSRPCMGTRCEIQIWTDNPARAARAFARAFAELERIEALMTDWRPDAPISRVNAAAGKEAVAVPPEVLQVVRRGLELGKLSDGGFDITVGVFRGLWKFDEDNDGSLPGAAEVKKRARLVDYRDVLIDEAAGTIRLRRPGQRLTLGGIAKGYAVDAAVRALRAEGETNFIVQAGGDLFASGQRGDRKWRVGIRDPRGPRDAIIYKMELRDQAFNTSGDYERFVLRDGVRYHHILDARTGFPARGTRSVTVLAPTAFEADLYDTTLFVMGPERAMKLVEDTPGIEAVIVDADNRVHVSSGLRDLLGYVAPPSPGP